MWLAIPRRKPHNFVVPEGGAMPAPRTPDITIRLEEERGMTIKTGQLAPDAIFGRGHGDEVSLADLWKAGPVVVAFLRHFG